MPHVMLCSLSDATLLESVKDADIPVIGDADRLDITMLYHKASADQEYLIRIKQNKKAFEVLEVLVKPSKPYVFDCLNLERYIIMCVCVCVCVCVRACMRVCVRACAL